MNLGEQKDGWLKVSESTISDGGVITKTETFQWKREGWDKSIYPHAKKSGRIRKSVRAVGKFFRSMCSCLFKKVRI